MAVEETRAEAMPGQSRGLALHLAEKGKAMRESSERFAKSTEWAESIRANCFADDLTGVRKLKVRDWQYVGDSGSAFGGWDLGPTSPELLCGVVATCFCHTYLMGAAWLEVPIDSVSIDVEASNNDAWFLGIAQSDPRTPFDFKVRATVKAEGAPPGRLADVAAYAEDRCPLLTIIRKATKLQVETVYA